MKISAEAEERLVEWLRRSNWHTSDKNDEYRFYRFIRALWQCNHSLIEESTLRERIVTKVLELHSDWNKDAAKKWISDQRYANRSQEIMDYHLANDA
jgi:hypothetical protein